MPKGVPNRRYTPEFRKQAVETMRKEKLGRREAERQFGTDDHRRAAAWERIYLDYDNDRRIKAKQKGLPPAVHRQQALSAA